MTMADLAFNPARSYNLINYRFHYAIGNTTASDLSEGCVLSSDPEFLLLGCGDIRNVLFTVAEVAKLKSRPNSLNFHLNDVDDLMLARDAVLFQIVNTIDSKDDEDIEFLWSVWYNAHLTKSQDERLRFILKDFLENPQSCIKYGSSESTESIKRLFKSWLKARITMKQLNDSRRQFFATYQVSDSFEDAYKNMSKQQFTSVIVDGEELIKKGGTEQEFENYYKFGSSFKKSTNLPSFIDTMDKSMLPNLTLFCPAVEGWRVHPASCPFMCYSKELFGAGKTLRENCVAQLREQVKHWQSFRESGGTLSITLWTGDGLTLCNYYLPDGQMFDFINTSNLIDSIGLMNVLMSCGKRLRSGGVLVTQTLLWFSEELPESVLDYADDQLDVPVHLYPTVFGLHLAEDLSTGNTKVSPLGIHSAADEVTMKWVRAPDMSHRINILGKVNGVFNDESPELLDGFSKIAKRCLRTFHGSVGASERSSLHTPSTLIYVIQNMENKIKGGVQTLITIAEQYLETEVSSTGESFKPLEPEWKMLLYIHFSRYTDQKYNPVTVQLTSVLGGTKALSYHKMRTGADAMFRGRVAVMNTSRVSFKTQPKFYVTTTLEYNHVTDTLTVLLPNCVIEECGGQAEFIPCNNNGGPMTQSTLLPQKSKPYDLRLTQRRLLEEGEEAPKDDLDVIESVAGCQVKSSEEKSRLWKIVDFKTSQTNSAEIYLQEKNKRSKTQTVSCSFPFFVKPNGKLAEKDGSSYVEFKKKDCRQNQDLLNLRQFDIRDLDKCTLPITRVDALINMMLMSPGVNTQGNTCSLQEALREIMVLAVQKHVEEIPEREVKVCIIELDQRGTGLYNSFVGYHPEDTMVVIRCLRQLAGKPLVDLLWFDYSTLHARGLMSDPKLRTENVLALMRLQMSEMKATCRVSKETAWQLKRLLHLNTRRTVQRKKESEIVWCSDGYLQAVYPFFSKTNMSIKLQRNFQWYESPSDVGRAMDAAMKPKEDSCAVCGACNSTLKKCSACKQVSYCGRACQMKDWKQGHKNSCKKSKG